MENTEIMYTVQGGHPRARVFHLSSSKEPNLAVPGRGTWPSGPLPALAITINANLSPKKLAVFGSPNRPE